MFCCNSWFMIYWLLMTVVNVSIHLHNPHTTVCDLKSNYQTSGNILLCVFQLQSVISLICLKEKSSQKTLGCYFQVITEKSNQLLETWYQMCILKCCAFIFHIAGSTSSPSVAVTDIFSKGSTLLEAEEGGTRDICSQRSILKTHSIPQVMAVLWHTAAADWNPHSDGCGQLRPWPCRNTLPDCFSVSWSGERDYTTVLDSP